jgi:uridylate kinase
LRAAEIGADAVLKATKVDGIYTSDPMIDPTAEKFDELDYMRAISDKLGVMDATAITMCMENDLPIRVFNMTVPGNITKAVRGEEIGTLVAAGSTR